MPVIILAEVTGETSGGMPGYIDLESPMMRVLPRGIDRPEVRLAAMDRVISVILQYLHE